MVSDTIVIVPDGFQDGHRMDGEFLGVVSLLFLFFVCFGFGERGLKTGGHPYRGGLSNRAARMVRGLDPGVG